MELKQYIFPIYCGGTIIGQGFLADGCLITAAHVVKDFPDCFTLLNGKRFEFSKAEPLFIGEGDIYRDPSMQDVAIYQYNEADSSLHLSVITPQRGDTLENYCMHEVMDFNKLNPSFELKMEPATVDGDEEGNYFFCNCHRFGGSSGSPLLKGNNVVGIMHGGDDKGLCAFLKVDILLDKLGLNETILAYCSNDSIACEGEDALWQPHASIVQKGGKLGVVINNGDSKDIIIPFLYDSWYNVDGRKTLIGTSFFDNYDDYIGYFALKNSDETLTFHGYDKNGNLSESFICNSFDKDTIVLHGKTYIGRAPNGDGYDDVRRMGYYYGNLGNDNCYFALQIGNKWALKSDDLAKTYIDFIECDGFYEIGWTPKGFFATLIKGNKYKLCIGQENGFPLTLPNEYDNISLRYFMTKDGTRVDGLCFVLRNGDFWTVCSNDLQLSAFHFNSVGYMIDANNIKVSQIVESREIEFSYNVDGSDAWNVKGIRFFTPNEIAAVAKAEVVPSSYGKSVCFFMKTGGQTFLPLSDHSHLTSGDTFDVKSGIIITLGRKGEIDICRVLE